VGFKSGDCEGQGIVCTVSLLKSEVKVFSAPRATSVLRNLIKINKNKNYNNY
jgi:hypothetical protein